MVTTPRSSLGKSGCPPGPHMDSAGDAGSVESLVQVASSLTMATAQPASFKMKSASSPVTVG
jgi:hypothetical protein